jgi:DNA polymerase-3 subunit epsilon
MNLTSLAHDPRLLRTRLVVIDFEGLTPAGRSPVPVEVAAITLLCQPDGNLHEVGRFESLMSPPADIPITSFDQASGIARALLATAPPTATVMAALDHHVFNPADAAGHTVRLVAQSAGTERTLLHGQREYCHRTWRPRCPTDQWRR